MSDDPVTIKHSEKQHCNTIRTCKACGCQFMSERYKLRMYCSRRCYGVAKAVPFSERFKRSIRVMETGCWHWKSDLPYPKTTINGKSIGVHRASYEMINGPIPGGLEACHRCDNPRCVRPDHVFLGTQSDNIIDASRKGRMKSNVNAKRKLNDAQVTAILLKLQDGITQLEIASMFGVSQSMVSKIRLGLSWSHVRL